MIGGRAQRPNTKGELLPSTIAKLQSKKPVKIVAFGDSITLGIDASGYRNVPPYMPTWADLFAWGLRQSVWLRWHQDDQHTGLGGMTAEQG